jgi:hypothetical protein
MRLARKVAYQADQELRRLHVEEWEEIYIRLSEQAGLSPVTIRMRQRLRTGVDDGREA